MPDDTTEDAEGVATVTTYPMDSRDQREDTFAHAKYIKGNTASQHECHQLEMKSAGHSINTGKHGRGQPGSLHGSGPVLGLVATLSAPRTVTRARSWDCTSCMPADCAARGSLVSPSGHPSQAPTEKAPLSQGPAEDVCWDSSS